MTVEPSPDREPDLEDARALPAGEDPPYSRAYTLYVIGVVFFVMVFNNVDRTILSILVEPIKAEFDMSDTEMGAAMGLAFTIVYSTLALPAARWADYGARRSIIALAIAVWSAFTIATGAVQNFTQLFLMRMGVGVGESGGTPPSLSLLSDYVPPKQRGRGLSVISMGAVTGMGLGMVVGGLINEQWGWRWAFVAAGAPGLLLAAVIRLTVREPARGGVEVTARALDRESAWGVARYMLSRPAFRFILIANAFSLFAAMGRNLWEPSFIIRIYEMGTAEAGIWYFLTSPVPSMLGIFLGGLFGDMLSRRDRRWYMWVPAVGQLISVPMLLAFLLWPEDHVLAVPVVGAIPVAFLWSIVGSVFGSFFTAPFLAMIQGIAKLRMRAMAAAISTMVSTFVGLCAGPLFVGVLSDYFSAEFGAEALRYSLLVPTSAPLLSAFFCLFAARHLVADLERSAEG